MNQEDIETVKALLVGICGLLVGILILLATIGGMLSGWLQSWKERQR